MDDLAFVAARLDDLELAAKIASVDDAWGELRRTIPAEPGTLNRNHRLMQEASPARMLREVAVMREILELAGEQFGYDLPEGVEDGRDPDERECDETVKGVLEGVVRTLAGIWSGHPDYRAERKP